MERKPERSPRLTMRDAAALAGVSAATFSRALNGHAEVSRETRDTVLRVAREHGYSTTRNGRGRAGSKTGLVGVTLPAVQQAYFAVILAGASEALYEHDLRIVLCPTQHEHDREVSLLVDRLMGGTTDGALLLLPQESDDELTALRDQGYRFVVIDPRRRLGEHIPAVSATHSSGAAEATGHLLGLGHRRIAAITGPPGWVATEERRRGYHAALAAAGAMPDPQLEVASDFTIEGGYRATAALLDLECPPSAIFAFNDPLAIGALQAARARSLDVPAQLSVIGFDDTLEASIVTPTLTTVRQPLAEMGRMAVNLLIRLLRNQRFEALHVELATKLVIRESAGPFLPRGR